MSRRAWWLGKRVAPPRFVLLGLMLVAGVAVGVPTLGWASGAMAGFDVAAAVFLLSLVPLLGGGEADKMREASRINDANRTALLGLTATVTTAILVAVAAELQGRPSAAEVALVLATLVIAWLFSNMVYALHYAHLYYLDDDGKDARGLGFPGCDEPDYWDFVYFAFTLGMTFQTSDVTIDARRMRKVVTGHTLAAFVFNLGVIAFTINVIGGG